MGRKKNENQEENLTEKFDVRLTKKDMRNLKYLAEKECLTHTSLARKIVLLYLKNAETN